MDLIYILAWWSALFLFNLPAIFIGQKIFGKLDDKGYAATKVLGIALVSFTIWLLASFKILPFTQINIYIVFLLYTFSFLLLKQKLKITRIMIFEEVLFFLGFGIWCLVRMYQPDILGLEKFTDFALLNATNRAQFFPFPDPWLAGFNVNYYYFGHFVTAMLAKFTTIDLPLVYNLMIAAIFGLAFSLSFSIGYNLTKSKMAGILAGLLVTLSGNLHTLYAFTTGYPIGENAAKPFWELLGFPNILGYWYPMAVRFIPYSIHEFPAYSFTVSDLHAHLLDIPFVLLTITVLLPFIPNLLNILIVSLLIAILLITSSLDGAIYLALMFLILLPKYKFKSLIYTLIVGAIAFILTRPFFNNFVPFVSGIRLNTIAQTPIYMFLVVWGFPLFLAISYFFSKNKNIFITASILLGLGLIFFPEVAYFKDIYPLHFRANTMFKLGYQAYILFSLCAPFVIFKNKPWKVILFPMLFLVLIYPYFSLRGYYSPFELRGLDGTAYLKNIQPEDYEIINWLNNNVKGQKEIVEAVGESYTNYSRFSTYTGLQTILGWPGHEWGWHMTPDVVMEKRADVQRIYETPNWEEAKNLLEKYHVNYVIIGNLETEAYPNLQQQKFDKNLKIVFETGSGKVYQL